MIIQHQSGAHNGVRFGGAVWGCGSQLLEVMVAAVIAGMMAATMTAA